MIYLAIIKLFCQNLFLRPSVTNKIKLSYKPRHKALISKNIKTLNFSCLLK